MKVGLLTFHAAHNYGAVLQAYGTLALLNSLGITANCIDYRPNYLAKQRIFPRLKNQPFSIKIKLIIEGMMVFYWRIKRRNRFNNFINSKLNTSKEGYLNLGKSHEAYIMGSDQIWNIQLTKGFDAPFWGNFKTKKGVVKVSYAASMSNYNLNTSQKKKMGELLKNFDAISVREEQSESFILDNFNIKTNTVLDPTFLLEKSQWSLISKKPTINTKYVLVYSIGLRDEALRVANLIAKQLNFKIVELTALVDKNVLFNKCQTASPEEFLGYFEHAAFIVTTSFHGTAFSIINKKPFYSIAHGNDKDTRQRTILNKLGLNNRLISIGETPILDEINYESVHTKLDLLRANSINFLKNSLGI
jgi:hypothetical protein